MTRQLARDQRGGQGVQLEYTLLPVEAIETVVLHTKPTDERVVERLDEHYVLELEHALQRVLVAKQKLHDLHERVLKHERLVSEEVVNAFVATKREV